MNDEITPKACANRNRRDFLRDSIGAAAVAIAGPTLIASTAHAAEPPILEESDPIAMALGYKADASQVDTSKYPKRSGEQGSKQICANCSLYQARDNAVGSCAAIPGKLVAGAGWCQAWVGNV